MTEWVLCYITAKDRQEALTLGRFLVEQKLAACINVIDGMVSVYFWQGKLEQSNEAVLIAKTRKDLTQALTQVIKEKHSYEVPCVLTLPVESGNAEYLSWLASNLAVKG